MAAVTQLGFYGKLPSRGDFIRRRVPAAFLDIWDGWLQRMVTATRHALGDRWLDTYLTSPVWRFALSPGVCGRYAYTGILMPSVDAVGRYYPLTLVAALPEGAVPLLHLVEQAQWYDRLEQLAVDALEGDEAFDLDGFDAQVESLGGELRPRVLPATLDAPAGRPVCFELEGLNQVTLSMLGVLAGELDRRGDGYSLWWSEGSERVHPCWSLCPGLPQGELFAAAMDGDWKGHGWEHRVAAWQEGEPAVPPPPTVPPRLSSSGISHPGHVREVNEDAFGEFPDLGIWVVADGVGGQESGATASRMVVEALRGLDPGGDLQSRLNRVRHSLNRVNDHLQHLANRPVDPVNSASTVAVLLAGEAGCGYVWAGDSRIYRLRSGRFLPVTRDHSLVQGLVDAGSLAREDAQVHPQANIITRAVGGASDLELEVGYGDLEPGDRFLLCSDGVHGVVTDDELAAVLGQGDCADAARRVIDLVLSRVARDNATAVVVDVMDWQ
ncbi:type VI secretion system-associated protein TagF [Ectothiorhodospiraceae bacterium WFHF3C12]|nr:type VI secretion system-associated protein TagF [Ectothiorhodospiraceae bacterium WFHF3C12]